MPTAFPSGVDPTLRMEAMSARLAANWWAIAIRGAIAILFGVLTFALPGLALASFIILFAAYMLVDGVFAIVAAIRAAQHHDRWGYMLIEGLIGILVGVMAFAWPTSAVFAFVILIAAWAIVSGGLMIAAAFRLHLTHGRWFLGLAGLVSVLFGVALAVAPGAGALALTLWVGAYALVFGIALVILAFRLRGRHSATPGADVGGGI
jgi:uncharacterized membrane protein HdeD (DUF308 family)